MRQIETRPSGAHARLGGAAALAAAAPAAFAPLAVMALSLDDAPLWSVALAVLGAAPLVALAGVAVGKPAPAWAFSAAAAPVAVSAAWFAWTSGGALSPAAPWAFAALLAAAVIGGPRSAFLAALAAAALAAALALAPDPPIRFFGFQPRAEREAMAAISWGSAGAAAAAAIWAALTGWARALPPLRHPTIAARQALSVLAEAGEICALRVDRDGAILQTIGAPKATLEIDRDTLRGLNVSAITHPDDQEALSALLRDRSRRVDPADPSQTAATDAAGDPRAAADAAEAAGAEDGRAQARLTIRMHSRLGGFRWIEAEAWRADALPPAPERDAGSAESEEDAMLVLRARWRPGAELDGDADPERSGFLAHVNTELRGALKSIVGYTEILKNELFGPLGSDRYRDYARRAHHDGAQLLEMIDELLDLAAIEAGRFAQKSERVDPAPLVDGAIRLVRARAEEAGVALAAEVDPSTPHIVADRRALRRVLVNMMLDAVARGRMGDIAKLRVDAEEDAVRFQLLAAPRPSAVGGFPAAYERRSEGSDADPAADGFGQRASFLPGDAAQARMGEARLGRMVASSLAERMGGSVMFASALDPERLSSGLGEGFPRSAGGAREMVYAEAILPMAPAETAGASDDREAAALAALQAQRDGAAAPPRVASDPVDAIEPLPDEADVPMFELREPKPKSATLPTVSQIAAFRKPEPTTEPVEEPERTPRRKTLPAGLRAPSDFGAPAADAQPVAPPPADAPAPERPTLTEKRPGGIDAAVLRAALDEAGDLSLPVPEDAPLAAPTRSETDAETTDAAAPEPVETKGAGSKAETEAEAEAAPEAETAPKDFNAAIEEEAAAIHAELAAEAAAKAKKSA